VSSAVFETCYSSHIIVNESSKEVHLGSCAWILFYYFTLSGSGLVGWLKEQRLHAYPYRSEYTDTGLYLGHIEWCGATTKSAMPPKKFNFLSHPLFTPSFMTCMKQATRIPFFFLQLVSKKSPKDYLDLWT
jgi:hypothetical protein